MIRITTLVALVIGSLTMGFSQDKLTKADVIKNVYSFKLDTNALQLTGNGWDSLKKEMTLNHYVLMGEYHNSMLVSKLTEIFFSELKKNDFSVWMTEISPLAADKLNKLVRDKSYPKSIIDFNKKYKKWSYSPIPFFSNSADFDMLKASKKYGFDLWGIDQDFFVGFDFVLDDVFHTLDDKMQIKYAALIDSVHKSTNDKYYKELFTLIKTPEAQKIKKALDASFAIYGDRTMAANSVRSTLMKNNFFNYELPYLKSNKPSPKVFFKAGSNHVARGYSSTKILDIGETISQFADMQSQKSLHIALAVRYEMEKKVKTDKLGDGDYPDELLALYNENQWVVVDLRPFRSTVQWMERNDKKIDLSQTMIDAIKSFDFFILSPEIGGN